MVRLLAATSLVASFAIAAPLRPVPLESANPDAERIAACARASSITDASLDAVVNTRSAALSSLSIKARADSEELRAAGCAEGTRTTMTECLKACLTATRNVGLPGATALPTVSWESALLQGLSQFLAERAQSEVGVWFFERFGAQLCATTNEKEKSVREHRVSLFPETCALLSQPQSGAAPGSLFTAALRSDLERLPGMALFSLDSTHDAALDAQRKALADGLFEVFSMLRRGGNPLEALAVFETDADLNKAADTLCHGSSQVGCLFLVVGFVTHYAKGLVSPTDRPEVERKLLEEKVNAKFGGDAKVLVDAIVRLVDAQRRWQQPPTSADDGLQRATTMLWHVGDLLNAGATVAKVPDVARVARVFTAASLTFRGDYAGALKELVLLGTDLFPPRLQKAVTLVADLANARDATSVASILDAQTAPVGSWRLKREGFSMSVTGLVGAGAGGEYAFNAPMRQWGASAGLFAQLGVDFTWAVGEQSTVGIMVTGLDLGQLTWSRIDAVARGVDGPEPIPQLGFAQVLSPGAYFVVGLGKSPIVFVLGASLAPQLRKYTVGGLTDESTVIRFNAGFSVDVTLLPLVGKSYLEKSK